MAALKASGVSATRRVRPPGLPLKLGLLGRKRSEAKVGSSRAALSEGEAMVTQPAPALRLYCQTPWAAVAVLPVMAKPPKAEAALAPPVTVRWSSAVSLKPKPRLEMRAPGGLGLSSVVAARLAAVAVGRSLTLVTVVAMERLTALQAPVVLVPPAVARLKVVVGEVLRPGRRWHRRGAPGGCRGCRGSWRQAESAPGCWR